MRIFCMGFFYFNCFLKLYAKIRNKEFIYINFITFIQSLSIHNSWQSLVNSAWHFWKAFLFFYLLPLCFFGHHFTEISTNLCSCTAIGKKSHRISVWLPTQSMEKDKVLQGAIQKLSSLLFLFFSSVSKMLLQNQGNLRKINSNGQERKKI